MNKTLVALLAVGAGSLAALGLLQFVPQPPPWWALYLTAPASFLAFAVVTVAVGRYLLGGDPSDPGKPGARR